MQVRTSAKQGTTMKAKVKQNKLLFHTYHPNHKVGEDCNPDRREDEGQHEVFLPARSGAVWDGEEEQKQQRP